MLKPLGERVVLKRLEQDDKTEAGIILAPDTKTKSQVCEVIEIGDGREKNDGSLTKMLVKKGDKVLITKYSGDNTYKENGEELIIIDQDQILAIIK